MIPKQQTRFSTGTSPKERGNCFPAVIASILEMEVEDVIQIQEYYDDPNWMQILISWLNEKGYMYTAGDHFKCFHALLGDGSLGKELKNQYYLVSGTSPRNNGINHIVIYQNGNMIHDPHPDGTGITSLTNFTCLERI